MVCPTCFCFDVQDQVNWDLCSGTRCRQWDGCLLSEFAMVAGGHNFRRQREQRYRHRFYRKGKYLPERCGFVGCIGCGRCVGACVAKIASPVELYNALLED
jgi:sulfhydrogenase subunit beta (sulfur reductase)